jgi:hypothetical protein
VGTGSPVTLPWPLTLAGLLDAWSSAVAPAQLVIKAARDGKDAYATKNYSIVGGISESKKKKITESRLLNVVVDEQDDAEMNVARLGDSTTVIAVATLEAASIAGISRLCDGHPDTVRNKEGETVPVVCFCCHAPSRWPGSPTKQAENVSAAQIKEWTQSALESIALMLEALVNGNPRHANDFAQAAGIGTDKVIEGTVVREVAEEYLRQVWHQFCRLGYTLRNASVQEIGTRLQAGGLGADVTPQAVMALAMTVPIQVMEKKDTVSLASLAYKLAHAMWPKRRRIDSERRS